MSICGASIGVPQDWNITQGPCMTGTCGSIPVDYVIKRHDTKPPFRVKIEDCNGALDLRDPTFVLEANIWFNTILRDPISNVDTDDYFRFIDNIGFDQVLVGDIIATTRPRDPEYMLVTAFDEGQKLIRVQRGYNGTPISAWKKGQTLLVFREMSVPAIIESVIEDITNMDGTVLPRQLTETYLVYEFSTICTCLAGCYLLEFKLLKMIPTDVPVGLSAIPSVIPSWTPSIPSGVSPSTYYHCTKGLGVDWVRRFPNNKGGFVIQVVESPTAEA